MTTLYCKACGAQNAADEPMAAVWVPCACGNRSWSTIKPERVTAIPLVDAPDPVTPYTLTRDDCLLLRTFCIEAP